MTKNRMGPPAGSPFGLTFDAEIHPATTLSPAELSARMEQGFSVTATRKKPAAAQPAQKKLVKGKIKVPVNAKVPTPEQVADMLKKPVPKKPVQAKPAPKPQPKKPPYRPPQPMSARTRTTDIMNVHREGDMFTVEPIDMKEIERRAALAKIVNRRVPRHLREEFLKKLKANQDAIAKFVMLEVATFDLAVPAALEIAAEYLNDSTDASPTVDLGRVQKMLPYITELKTLLYLCELTGVSKAHAQMLLRTMIDPETPKPVDPMQALTKLLQANRAQPPAPPKPTRREIREQRESNRRTQALLHALRSK